MMDAMTTDRRAFLTKIVPACALTCVGVKSVPALVHRGKHAYLQEEVHKFDQEFDRKLTYRQMLGARYRDLIDLARALEKEMGKDKMIEFLKKTTTERLLNFGKQQAERMQDNTFDAYVNQFRSGYDKTLTMEIVEDTEKAFELNVTECIWADTFLRADAGDIGYAWVCWGDYAWAEGFNPKIKLIRDKTLMEGKTCCNHRYVWLG
jgi:hypothetical protein